MAHDTRRAADSADYGGTRNCSSRQAEPVIEIDDLTDVGASKRTHCHTQNQQTTGVNKKAQRKLVAASILCLLFMIGEIVGGVLANSLAIISDAAHMLTDVTGFIISLISIYLASRPATKRMNFGWHRAEVMGALVSVLLIWVVTAVLVYMAAMRVYHQDYNINATVMLITAAVGVGVNLLLGLTLAAGGGEAAHQHSHSIGGHSHNLSRSAPRKSYDDISVDKPRDSDVSSVTLGSEANLDDAVALDEHQRLVSGKPRLARPSCEPSMSTQSSCEVNKSHMNINVRAAFIHVLGDLTQSVGVVVAALIIYYKPEWKLADPICTFMFSIIVLFTTVTILRDIVNVLMEGVPNDVSFNDVKKCLEKIEGVKAIHNLHIWSLTTNKTAISVHLALAENVCQQSIIATARKQLHNHFDVFECTVQTERYAEVMSTCTDCIGPAD